MNTLAPVLSAAYLLLPLFALAVGIRRARRNRSAAPLRPLVATLVSALLIAFALNFAYARAAGADASWGQAFLTAWFAAGVLLALKAFDAGLKKLAAGAERRLGGAMGTRGAKAAGITMRVVLLFGVGLAYVMGLAMVYRPKVRGPDPMEQLGFGFEDVRIQGAGGGPRLTAWWVAPPPPPPVDQAPARWGEHTVLLCHGLGASKSNALPMADHLVRAGYNVLAVDLRAHGSSGGQVTTFGDHERRDVLAAVAWLRRQRPEESRQIFGVGASMGAAALVAAAADESPEGRAIDAVAVYGTYDDLGALARTTCDRHFPPPLNWLGRWVAVPVAGVHCGSNLHRFAPAEMIGRIAPRPVLVIHGRDDEIIAFEHGRRLFESAGESKRSLWLDGDHNSVLMDAEAARAVRAFFDAADDSAR